MIVADARTILSLVDATVRALALHLLADQAEHGKRTTQDITFLVKG